MSKAVCAACGHAIDDAARLCPYCGADPRSGEKVVDTQAILQEEFQPRRAATATEGVLDFARRRQGIVIALGVIALILILGAFHEFVSRRNATAVSDAAAVPLTDVADLNNQAEDTQKLPMPELQYQYDGNPQRMHTYIVEPGAVPPATATQGAAPQPAPNGQPSPAGGGQPPSAVQPLKPPKQ